MKPYNFQAVDGAEFHHMLLRHLRGPVILL